MGKGTLVKFNKARSAEALSACIRKSAGPMKGGSVRPEGKGGAKNVQLGYLAEYDEDMDDLLDDEDDC